MYFFSEVGLDFTMVMEVPELTDVNLAGFYPENPLS